MDEIAKVYDRIPSAQLVWLGKKGIAPPVAQTALSMVYDELSRGATYPDGAALDQALLARARGLAAEDAETALRTQQDRIKALTEARLNEHLGYRRPAKWARHPIQSVRYWRRSIYSFLLGAASVGAVWAWISWS